MKYRELEKYQPELVAKLRIHDEAIMLGRFAIVASVLAIAFGLIAVLFIRGIL